MNCPRHTAAVAGYGCIPRSAHRRIRKSRDCVSANASSSTLSAVIYRFVSSTAAGARALNKIDAVRVSTSGRPSTAAAIMRRRIASCVCSSNIQTVTSLSAFTSPKIVETVKVQLT